MLAADIGNTFIRVVAFVGDDICVRRSLPTRGAAAEALAAVFSELAARADSASLWVASVAPFAEPAFVEASRKAGLPQPYFIRSASDHIIRHRLSTPETTGVDRLLSAMAAGRRHFPASAGKGSGYVTVQCGSAATVDVVDGDGVFLGGHILPGPPLWLAGLAGAAQIPDFSANPPDWETTAAGDNTRDAIMRGLTAALPGAVAASVRRLRADIGSAGNVPPVAVTGGWGREVVRELGNGTVYDGDLLLHGIRLVAEDRQ